MVKTIKIGNKEYDLKSSAYTMFAYKDQMGRDLLKDLNDLNKLQVKIGNLPKEEQDEAWLNEASGLVEKTLKLAYIMIKEQNKDFKEYTEWLKDIDGLLDDATWISQVLEVGISPFRGRL